MKRKHFLRMRSLLTLIMSVMAFGLYAQNITIKGTVTDDTGMTVIGATIIVESDASRGTVTDIDGNYELTNVASDANLVFSYVGYKTQVISVNGRSTIYVVMSSDTELLDEVVIVGFGTQKKVNLTGSVATIDNKMLESRPITSVSAGLAGLLPGVSVRQSSGLPGGDGGTIRIRGTGTLNQASPMVLIDGVEASLNDVQANDIANISVLKDAASSAIYGSKAANGVILITTKSGRSGKPVVSYMGDFGWQSPTKLPEYLGSYDYGVLFNEALANSGKAPKFTDNDLKLFRDGSSPYT
ncbi:MAG: TonB-dependent receptor plug domain-containing protein, partial [Bacteroidales bacterium]|nr:TonB-dependent receptor plug domain-containing protein [Bacteroidales bacterium]